MFSYGAGGRDELTPRAYTGFVWIRFDPEGEPITWDNAKIRMKQDT